VCTWNASVSISTKIAQGAEASEERGAELPATLGAKLLTVRNFGVAQLIRFRLVSSFFDRKHFRFRTLAHQELVV